MLQSNSIVTDSNGNMVTRNIAAGQPLAGSYTLSYDGENRLTEVKKDNAVIASFVYDGDGRRVKSVLSTDAGDSTTYFVGNYYEVTDGVVTKYYYAGTQRIAMRKNGTLYFILGDHLGSTSLVTSASGLVVSQTTYKACPQGASQAGSQASVWNTADKLHLHGTI